MSKSLLVVLALALTLMGCAPKSEMTSPASPTPEALVTSIAPTSPVTLTVSGGLVNFTDGDIPFSMEYPEGWVMDTLAFGARISTVYVITSLDYIPNISVAVPEGETVIVITPHEWKPGRDLAAFTEAQKVDWAKGGYTLVSEEDITANNGAPAKFVVLDAPEARYYLVLAMAGENYIVLSGRGDGAIVRQIGMTIR